MKLKRLMSFVLSAVMLLGGNTFTFAADDVTSDDFSKEDLEMNGYDIYKYTLPYWEGNIVYNECVYPIKSPDGEPQKAYKLMYDATEIISVRNYVMSVTYEEGRDYYLKDGMLYINPDGNIPTIEHDTIHPTENPNNLEWTVLYPTRDGKGYEFWEESSRLSGETLVVSYIHNDTWDHPIPTSVAEDLPKTMEMLTNKKDITIVVNGDSVSAGAFSSGALGLYPYADAYPAMTAKALEAKFGVNVNLVNTAIGGTMSTFTPELLDQTVIQHSPDLVIINYGMNDSSCDRVGIPKEDFKANVEGRINYIRERFPDCEFLLVSSLLGNIYTFPRERYEEHTAAYAEIAAEYEGVAFCNPQSIMGSIIDSGKDYICFMSDNMVHPNDYGMRLTTQCILAALDCPDVEEYKRDQLRRLTEYAELDKYAESEKYGELLDIIERVELAIADLDKVWNVTEAMNGVWDEIDTIHRRCDYFEDHIFNDIVTFVTCNTDGYTHSICTTCGFEYDHSFVTAPGLEHIMDEGRITAHANYKSDGKFISTCNTCGWEDVTVIPKLKDAPVLNDSNHLHIANGLNYMQTETVTPYKSGTGAFEMDICPLDISSSKVATSYVGLWFAGYGLCAAYNFRHQRVEIVSVDLPYTGEPTVYASAPYEWTTDSGRFEHNWKKFCVKISGNTVQIYIDGELILQDTNSKYSTRDEVVLPYTAGEFYLDNFKVVSGNYNPVDGRGGTDVWEWNLDTSVSHDKFYDEWIFGGYTTVKEEKATKVTKSTAVYGNHSHEVMAYISSVKPTCSLGGYREYLCETCSEIVFTDRTDPTSEAGHDIVEVGYSKRPTDTEDGELVYECTTCGDRFTQIIPAGTEIDAITGDANGDEAVDSSDLMLLTRHVAGLYAEMDEFAADINGDSLIDSTDVMILKRKIAGLSA